MSQPDVLVVGAGPTGLTMASRAAPPRRELPRSSTASPRATASRAPPTSTRARSSCSRTSASSATILGPGPQADGDQHVQTTATRFLHVPLEGADTPYCFMLGLEQSEVEADPRGPPRASSAARSSATSGSPASASTTAASTRPCSTPTTPGRSRGSAGWSAATAPTARSAPGSRWRSRARPSRRSSCSPTSRSSWDLPSDERGPALQQRPRRAAGPGPARRRLGPPVRRHRPRRGSGARPRHLRPHRARADRHRRRRSATSAG